MLSKKIKQHIATNYLDGEGDDLTNDTPLTELNIIDSASIFDLVDFIKEVTGLNVPMVEINPGNFASIDSMCQLVTRLENT